MEFYQYRTTYEEMQRIKSKRWTGPLDGFHTRVLATMLHSPGDGTMNEKRNAVYHCLAEHWWLAHRRPFYRVWPQALDLLLKLDLDRVTGDMVTPLSGVVSICFPTQDRTIECGEHRVRSFMVTSLGFDLKPCGTERPVTLAEIVNLGKPRANVVDGLVLWIDYGETMKVFDQDTVLSTYSMFPLRKGKAIATELAGIPAEPQRADDPVPIDADVIAQCVKLYCTLCLIDQKKCNLIQRIVLNRDRHKFENATPAQLAAIFASADKRGMNGWDLGRDIEIMPYVRQAHPCLFWTGVGRTVPKIITRAGSIIHQGTMGKVSAPKPRL